MYVINALQISLHLSNVGLTTVDIASNGIFVREYKTIYTSSMNVNYRNLRYLIMYRLI